MVAAAVSLVPKVSTISDSLDNMYCCVQPPSHDREVHRRQDKVALFCHKPERKVCYGIPVPSLSDILQVICDFAQWPAAAPAVSIQTIAGTLWLTDSKPVFGDEFLMRTKSRHYRYCRCL